jgi:hypothetical protein
MRKEREREKRQGSESFTFFPFFAAFNQ